MQSIASEVGIQRQRVAFRQLDHDGPPPHVVGGEVLAIVLPVWAELANMREG